MAERGYTVAELDALRQCHDNMYLYGAYSGPGSRQRMSRSFHETEKAKVVEEMVRTSMLAGHTAEDLLASEGAASPTEKGSE